MNSQSNDQNCAPQKRSFGILGKVKSVFAIIGIISVTFFILFIVFVGVALSSFSSNIKTFSSSLSQPLASKTGLTFSVPGNKSSYVAGIRLDGEITEDTATSILEKLETAKNDIHAVGILLDVNSPGGSVVASQEIYDAIKEITKTKPVVSYVREVAASGAYYSCAPSTKIVANRGSIIGSIGVIMNGFEADKLIQFLKINPVVIKTGALKDTGSPTRPMNEKDKQYLQELIEETRSQFVEDVKQARKTTDSTMKLMSDGRVVLGMQALNLKLVDIIGSKQTAIEQIAFLAKEKKIPELYYYEDIQSFSDLFAQKLAGSSANILQKSITNLIQSQESKGSHKIPRAEF